MNVTVIGGGPAGMMAAGTLQELGNSVTLLEKNPKLGMKLYITGKGRANITNQCSIDEFIINIQSNPKFLISALNKFSPQDTIYYYEKWGVPIKVERGGRAFPLSDKSSDIIKAHIRQLELYKVKVITNAEVKSLIIKEGKILGVNLTKGSILSDCVVIATGGLSYPLTGSTGDGYEFARASGHKINKPVPALVPLILDGTSELEGLSLRNIEAKIIKDSKIIYREIGEMVFTDNGASGPVILTLSSRINRMSNMKLSIDLKPALSNEELDIRIQRDFMKYNNKDYLNSLDELLPKSIIPMIIRRSGIDARKKVHQIDKFERANLVNLIKNLVFDIIGLDDIASAIVTSGGVDTKDINPKTMESRIVKGLYFAGEVIDVDALTGGFNIQIALSTGYLAACSINQRKIACNTTDNIIK